MEETNSIQGFEHLSEDRSSTKSIAKEENNQLNRDGKDSIQLPLDLTIETTVLDLPEEEKIYKETGLPLQIGLLILGCKKSFQLFYFLSFRISIAVEFLISIHYHCRLRSGLVGNCR